MKYTAIASVILWASLALAAPTEKLNKRFNLVGAPSNDVTCPDHSTGSTSTFTAAYVANNIDIMLSNNKKKGSYPKPFNRNNPHAGQFTWLNKCVSENVLELPMFKNTEGAEIPWWENTSWTNSRGKPNNNFPGAFREYYMYDADTGIATYCGAYAHADQNSDGDFVACT